MEKENLTKIVLRGSLWSTVASVVHRLGGLVFVIILARYLLPKGFGLYSLVSSIVLVFSMFTQEGMDTGLVRYISEARKLKSKVKEKKYFLFLTSIKLFLVLLISLILISLSYPMATFIFKNSLILYPLMFATAFVFVQSLDTFFSGYFLAIKKVNVTTSKGTIFQFLRIILLIALFSLFGVSVNLAFIAMLIASTITVTFLIYKIYKVSPYILSRSPKLEKKTKKRITRFVSFVTLAGISYVALANIDTLMIGYLIKGTEAVGFYRASFSIISSVAGLLAFKEVLLPIFVETDNLEFSYNKVLRYSLIIAIPATAGLILFGSQLIVLLYGRVYLQAASSLSVLSLLVISSLRVTLYSDLFAAKEKPKEYLSLLIFVVLENIFLNYLLIKILSQYSIGLAITGAAIATVLSWETYAWGLEYLVRKKLKIKSDFSFIGKPIIATLVMIATFYVLKSFLGDITIVNGIILVAGSIITYSATLILIKGVNKKEDYKLLEALKSILRKRK